MATPIPIKIKLEGQDQKSSFASDFTIFNTANEFVMSMIEIIPQMQLTTKEITDSSGQRKRVSRMQTNHILQKVLGRYAMTPAAFKKLVNIANQNLKKYEEKFGEIVINPPENLQ